MRAALVSLLVVVAVYGDVVFGGRTFLPVGRVPEAYVERPDQRSPTGRAELDPGAFAWEVMPWAHVEHRALAAGELPLWDRSNGLGHPLLGSGQTALFFPLHWLPLIDPSKPVLWDLSFLLLRFFAALGSVLLLLELGAPFWLAALGAPIGALNGTFNVLLTRADLQAYACMPWILLSLVRLRRAPGPRPALGLALAMALCVFAAHPEPSFAVLATCALAAAAMLFREEPKRLGFLAWSAVGTVCAALLSAPFWLPLFDLIPRSWSLHAPGTYGPGRPFGRIAEWLMPTVFEHGDLRTIFGGGPQAPFAYLGPVCGVLAVAAVIGAVRTRAIAWVWPALFLVLVMHGVPAGVWRLPLVSRMPIDFYFAFPVLYLLAVSGVSALDRRTAILAAIVVVAALATVPIWARDVDQPLVKLGWAAVVALVFAALALRPRLRPLLFVACAADLGIFRAPLARRADPLASGPFVEWLRGQRGQFRVMGLGWTMVPDTAAAFGLEDVRLCEALFPERVVSAMSALVQFKPDSTWFTSANVADGFDASSPLLDWMNVRYFVTQRAPPENVAGGLKIAYRDPFVPDLVVLERPHPWPRVTIAASPELSADPLAAMKNSRPEPFAIVESDFPGCEGCTGPLRATATPPAYRQNRVAFTTDVNRPAIAVLADAWSDGWRATIDGRETPLFHVNWAFRGVVVPAGKHVVEMRYAPRAWILAFWLALAGVALAAYVASSGWRRSVPSES